MAWKSEWANWSEIPPPKRVAANLKPYYLISQGGCSTNYLRGYMQRFARGDHMGYAPQFGGCNWNHHSAKPNVDIGESRLLYISAHPCDATLSFQRRNFLVEPTHVTKVSGNVEGMIKGRPWSVEKYVANGEDFFRLEKHYNNWRHFDERTYDIMFVKYNAMGENIERMLEWLGFDPDAAQYFQRRDRAANWLGTDPKIQEGLHNMFGPYIQRWEELPDVEVCYKGKTNG